MNALPLRFSSAGHPKYTMVPGAFSPSSWCFRPKAAPKVVSAAVARRSRHALLAKRDGLLGETAQGVILAQETDDRATAPPGGHESQAGCRLVFVQGEFGQFPDGVRNPDNGLSFLLYVP